MASMRRVLTVCVLTFRMTAGSAAVMADGPSALPRSLATPSDGVERTFVNPIGACCPGSAYVAGELLICFEPGTPEARVEVIADDVGAAVIDLITDPPTGPLYLMQVPVGEELGWALVLCLNSRILYIHLNLCSETLLLALAVQAFQ